MKITNPNADKAIIARIIDDESGAGVWHEIPAGESVEVTDYVVASTLVEYGAVAAPAELQAARELWAEHNRARNSQTASASASEGVIIGRRQATVDVATGTVSSNDEPLKGSALAAAVEAANDAGAGIDVKLKADEKRAALAKWQATRGTSTPAGEEYVVDGEGNLVLDSEDQPYRLDQVKVDDLGAPLFGEDGQPVLLPVAPEQVVVELPSGQPATSEGDAGLDVVRNGDGDPVDSEHNAGADEASAQPAESTQE